MFQLRLTGSKINQRKRCKTKFQMQATLAIVESGLQVVALAEKAQTPDPDEHAYLRGNNYYKSLEQDKDATDGGNKEDE